jgi:hypothetical protein
MILLLLILLNFLPISFYDSSYIVLKYFYIFITQLIQKCILIAREFLEKLSNYFLISFRFFFFFYNNLEYFFPDFNILNYYSKPPKREEPTPYVLFSYFFNAICYPFNFGIFKISFRTGFFFLLDHYQSVKSFNRSDAGFFIILIILRVRLATFGRSVYLILFLMKNLMMLLHVMKQQRIIILNLFPNKIKNLLLILFIYLLV